MPSPGVELNRTNFYKLLFQTPGKLHQKNFAPLSAHSDCPYQSDNQWLRKMWKEDILQPGKCNHKGHCRQKMSTQRRKGWNNRFVFSWQSEAAENMNLMKQPKLQWRMRSRKERGWLQGETALPVPSRPLQRCYQMRRQKSDGSRNQQLGENEQIRKEYVWLFCTWLMGEKRSLNLCGVRSPWVTWALQSSTIVLPEAFPSGWPKENNCFHHLLF